MNDMPCAFNPCPLEIKINSGLKREGLEFSPLVTKNITSMSMTTKLGRVVTYPEGTLSHKIT